MSGEMDRWNPWDRWLANIMWTVIETLTIAAPSEMFEYALRFLFVFLTANAELAGTH